MIESLISNSALVTAWTAIAALAISFLSIVLTTLNLWMQRTHNRKSVLPIGHIAVGDYEEDVFVRLRNDGIGPMIIEDVTVYRTNKPGDSKNSIIDFMPELPGEYAWATFLRDIIGRAVSPQDQLTLIELKGEPTHEDFEASKNIVRRVLSELSVTVSCKNIYNERMPTISRRLDWFGRSK